MTIYDCVLDDSEQEILLISFSPVKFKINFASPKLFQIENLLAVYIAHTHSVK